MLHLIEIRDEFINCQYPEINVNPQYALDPELMRWLYDCGTFQVDWFICHQRALIRRTYQHTSAGIGIGRDAIITIAFTEKVDITLLVEFKLRWA